jgi:hypothetical protein
LLRESRVNHVVYALQPNVNKVEIRSIMRAKSKRTVDGDRRLGDVGGDYTLAFSGRSWVEDAALHFGGQLRVNGIHVELGYKLPEALQALVKERAS